MRIFPRSVLFLLLFIFWCDYDAWGRVYLDIDSPTFKPFLIAVPDFQAFSGNREQKDNSPASMSGSLSDYLMMTGFFNVISRNAYLEDQKPAPEGANEAIRFADWMAIGAEYLVKGKFQYRGKELTLECRLYDAVRSELVVGKKYAGNASERKKMIRKFAGEVLSALTGVGGIFSTRVTFVEKKGKTWGIFSIGFDGDVSDLLRHKEGNTVLMSPRWSPDGRYISYTSFEEGNPDFYIKDMVNSKVTPIASFQGINLSGGWSPKSDKVLLTLSRDGNEEIYVLDFANKLLQRLTNNFAIDVSPAWSPDGSKIAFVSNRSGTPQIYIMDADGNNVRRLTYDGNYNTSPSWSPQSQDDRIVFESRTAGNFQIFTIGLDGNNLKQMTFEKGSSESPSWSPDGRYIAFIQNNGVKNKIYVMNATGSNVRLLYEGSGDCSFTSWSPLIKLE
ncbi:MAG TPA: Tol-Pal system beta propeller repeat protein TolB [Syntrophales bacterium]|nr:Tol-Pal system beta propeller repeat protein TolB [Syntrophales bacterium]